MLNNREKFLALGIFLTFMLFSMVSASSPLISCPSNNDISCYPIYINNAQSIATGNDFQQMINLTETQFPSLKFNKSYANFEYTYTNGTVIPAWIENNMSEKLITFLNLSKGINANTNTVIILNIKSNNQLNASGINGIGESPQLSVINVWKKLGVLQNYGGSISPPLYGVNTIYGVEPTVMYQGNAQILPTTGNVFKMWYRSNQGVQLDYAESYNGIYWYNIPGNAVLQCSGLDECTQPFVTEIGGTYYLYINGNTTANEGNMSIYTSPNGIKWTLIAQNINPRDGKAWDSGPAIGNRYVWRNNSTGEWYMLYEAANFTHLVWKTGLATSSNGITWTPDTSANPVLSPVGGTGDFGGPELHIINGTYYVWGQCTMQSLQLPTDICIASSNNLINWNFSNKNPVFFRNESFEGANYNFGQVADPSIVSANGLTYMFYEGLYNQSDYSQLAVAVSNMTLAQIVKTGEMNDSYAKYDDGSHVFQFYKNFPFSQYAEVNYSVPSGLAFVSTGTFAPKDRPNMVIADGLTIAGTANVINGWSYITSQKSFNPSNSILDYYGYETGTTTIQYIDGFNVGGFSPPQYDITDGTSGYYLFNSNSLGHTEVPLSGTSTTSPQVFSIWANSIESFATVNYANTTSLSAYYTPSTSSNLTFAQYASSPNKNVVFWTDIRAIPPNGIMPSYSYSALIDPSVVNKTSVDNGQKVKITAQWSGGTAPYNAFIYFTPSYDSSCIYDGLPLSTQTGISGNTVSFIETPTQSGFYCVNVTDSNSISTTTATNTITFYQTPQINSGYILYVKNSQSNSIPANTQILLNINASKLNGINTNTYNNIELTYNGSILYTWLENVTSSKNITMWTKLPITLPGNSEALINIVIAPSNTNLLNAQTTGEAPQLSSSYAQYDNGANIFNFYDDFSGTKLNTALWNPIGNSIDASYTINNGITFTVSATSNQVTLYSLNKYNPANYIQEQGIRSLNIPTLDDAYTAEWYLNPPTNTGVINESYLFDLINTGSGLQYRVCNVPFSCGSLIGSGISNNNIFGAYWLSTGTEYIYQNYIQEYSYGNSGYSITPSYIGTQFNTYINSGPTINGTLNFIRLREYPPNDIMPSTITTQSIADGFTASSYNITQGQTETLTASVVGGASPYTYNYSIYNSAGQLVNNKINTNVSNTNSYSYQQNIAWGSGNFVAKVIITDSNGAKTNNTLTYSVIQSNNALACASVLSPLIAIITAIGIIAAIMILLSIFGPITILNVTINKMDTPQLVKMLGLLIIGLLIVVILFYVTGIGINVIPSTACAG